MWDFANNRFILGTARYSSPEVVKRSVERSGAEIITVSLRREVKGEGFWQFLRDLPVKILPNTAGCHTVEEVIMIAEMAREVFETSWIKVEVIGDDYTLQPDTIRLIRACEELIKRDFTVFPYTTEDLVVAKSLVDLGCRVLMPWGSPIGTGKGLSNLYALKTLRARLPDTTLIIDAGIGTPSQACQIMEMGFDGVLVNTAVALADDPPSMAEAFSSAVAFGRQARKAGIMKSRDVAEASTPVMGSPFWQGVVT